MFNLKMVKIKQEFENNYIENIRLHLLSELEGSNIKIKKGERIAIAIGSRGVTNIALMTKTIVEFVREMGGEPFVVPAMGSHGGATSAGQRLVLNSYGITQEYINAPIVSSMDVVELNNEGLENKLFMDKNAYKADGIIVVNRVKAHTDFHGDIESGLMKMCVIGLGKHQQALEIHKYGIYGLRNLIVPSARKILSTGKVILGIASVENAYDKTSTIKAIIPKDIERIEKELLIQSKSLMPSLPVDNIDLLIVDEMGKDISGVGMDPNIIGRTMIRGESEPLKPIINNIYVRDLTEVTHGNAIGIGLADYISRTLFNKIDYISTYQNVVTSTFLQRGFIPLIVDSDDMAIQYAMQTCGVKNLKNARIMHIKNTLELDEINVSESIFNELNHNNEVTIIDNNIDLLDEKMEIVRFN